MKKFLSKHAFWVVQVLGWSMFWGWNLFTSEYERTVGESIYYLVSWFIESVMATSCLRWILKKSNFDISSITFLNFFKLLAAFCVSNFLFIGVYRFMIFFRLFFFEPFSEGSGRGFWKDFIFCGIILAGWTLCYLLIILFRKLNSQRIERLKISSNLKQAQLNVLRGQLNPDFLIDSLNGIKTLSFKDILKARGVLTQLSDLLRYSLTKNDVNTVHLDEELNMVDCYIDLANSKSKSQLQIEKKIDDKDLLIPVPPMMMVKLLEIINRNTLLCSEGENKIGIETTNKGGKILLSLSVPGQVGDTLSLIERDLKETRQRFKLLYGSKGNFSIKAGNGQVFIEMLMPIMEHTKQ